MPPVKTSLSNQLRVYVRENEDVLSTDGQVLFCVACERRITADTRFQVTQHLKTAKHLKNVSLKKSAKQCILKVNPSNEATCSTSGPQISNFNMELCEAFTSADIPLFKLEHPKLRSFLETHIKQTVPHESTLRKHYVPLIYEKTVQEIRDSIKENIIWVSLDETTDACKRFVCNVIVGTLHENEISKAYLLTVEEMAATNHTTIAKVFNNAMLLLWPDGIRYENVVLFLSDAAPYMIKAGHGLTVLYNRMIHVTCLAHAVHRLSETVRLNFDTVNSLISSVKKVFLKSPSRINLFKRLAPEIPLPPEPIVTRWGTWLKAAIYYCDNFHIIENILKELDENEAESIVGAKSAINRDGIKEELIYIKSHFKCVSTAIKMLERKDVPLVTNISVIENLLLELNSAPGEVAKKVVEKFNYILQKNVGYHTLQHIANILSGKRESKLSDIKETLSLEEIANFKYAPVTSVDVERSFSEYKSILRSNRESFVFSNLKMVTVIHCNGKN